MKQGEVYMFEDFYKKAMRKFSLLTIFVFTLVNVIVSVIGLFHAQSESKIGNVFDGVFIFLLFVFLSTIGLIMFFDKLDEK